MAELAEKTKPARYPLGTIKQARNTLARLTRDLLNSKIDREKYRAACYGISVQCGLFRLEIPEQPNQKLSPSDIRELENYRKMAQMSRDESVELEKELMGKILRFEDTDVLLAELTRRGVLKKDTISNNSPAMIETNYEPESTPEIEIMELPESVGETWRPCGIGAKNR